MQKFLHESQMSLVNLYEYQLLRYRNLDTDFNFFSSICKFFLMTGALNCTFNFKSFRCLIIRNLHYWTTHFEMINFSNLGYLNCFRKVLFCQVDAIFFMMLTSTVLILFCIENSLFVSSLGLLFIKQFQWISSLKFWLFLSGICNDLF